MLESMIRSRRMHTRAESDRRRQCSVRAERRDHVSTCETDRRKYPGIKCIEVCDRIARSNRAGAEGTILRRPGPFDQGLAAETGEERRVIWRMS